MAPTDLEKTQGYLDSISKIVTTLTGIIGPLFAFLITAKGWFSEFPRLPEFILWLSVATFAILGLFLVSVQLKRRRSKRRSRLLLLGTFLIIGPLIAGFQICSSVFWLTPDDSKKLKNLKIIAKSNPDEPKVVKKALDEAMELYPRDPEVLKMLKDLEKK